MKKTLFFLASIFVVVMLNGQSNTDTLTNEKVIQLSKIGLDPSVIISKIQTSINRFDVSTDGLIDLSKHGVSAEVINEMMKSDEQTRIELANEQDMRDPKTKRPVGIYYYNSSNSKLFTRVEAAVITNMSSGGFGNALARSYTAGIAKAKLKVTVAGANSRVQVAEANPVFYFYFENNSNPIADDWFFASATSPNEFALVKLNERKNERETVIGTENDYGSSAGIPNKLKVPFDYEEIAEGIYKVTFTEPLEPGEYCFLYASTIPTNYANDKVFDFGIRDEN